MESYHIFTFHSEFHCEMKCEMARQFHSEITFPMCVISHAILPLIPIASAYQTSIPPFALYTAVVALAVSTDSLLLSMTPWAPASPMSTMPSASRITPAFLKTKMRTIVITSSI